MKKKFSLYSFRTLNNNLPIESRRCQNTSRENRKCHLCNAKNIGDEYHFLFKCTSFDYDPKTVLAEEKNVKRPNIIQLKTLMNSLLPPVLNIKC